MFGIATPHRQIRESLPSIEAEHLPRQHALPDPAQSLEDRHGRFPGRRSDALAQPVKIAATADEAALQDSRLAPCLENTILVAIRRSSGEARHRRLRDSQWMIGTTLVEHHERPGERCRILKASATDGLAGAPQRFPRPATLPQRSVERLLRVGGDRVEHRAGVRDHLPEPGPVQRRRRTARFPGQGLRVGHALAMAARQIEEPGKGYGRGPQPRQERGHRHGIRLARVGLEQQPAWRTMA